MSLKLITYQDLLAVGEDERLRADFVRSLISTHQSSDDYKMALIAEDYDRKQNVTIMEYRKLLYTISGQAVEDSYSANYKICSSFFNRFVTQQNQFLLGNGINWNEDSTSQKLGKDFDVRVQQLGHYALVDKISFGFWNYDHLEAFRLKEFCPLWDEEDGGLKAGVRFWQIDPIKPLRGTLYELDGYTNYVWRAGEPVEIQPKRPYKLKVRTSIVDGTEIYDGENYPGFPIVPFWGNQQRQSELVGIREGIDAYDLIKSGFANDLDDASQIYWIIQNAGGMDDIDLARFVQRMKTVKAAVVDDDGARAESHTMDVPYASREALLERLRSDLYDDFMALDTKAIAGGATTATQIKAAYEPLNNKTDMYEYCVIDFLQGILEIAGIEDEPTFTRSLIVNTQEEISVITQAAMYLSEDYVTEKILTLLGDIDKLNDMLEERDSENMQRLDEIPTDDEEVTEVGTEI